jgi:hypothetical protein
MKKHNKKKARPRHRVYRPSAKQRIIDMDPEGLARYARQAEEQVLPIIKELDIDAGAAIFLLAQYAQALITGNPHITIESAMSITDSILALWQTGTYHPSAQYPFTLEETLQDLKEGANAKADYSKYFQPFTPSNTSQPVGIGQVAGGIVQHPKTHLWQIWMIMEGPCAFLGAYRDPVKAQKSLERVVDIARHGVAKDATYKDIATSAQHLRRELLLQGDGEPEQIPYDMMTYLLENIHLYTIEL